MMMSARTNARLEGLSVVVTGGASGIGRESALLFGGAGARVAISDINRSEGEAVCSLVTEAGGTAIFVETDVSDQRQVARLIDETVKHFGGIDAIINIAGTQTAARVTECTLEQWQAVMAVNATGCFLTAKYGVPHLIKRGGGGIVNVASLAALNGAPGMGAYSASKGAVVALSRSLAAELGEFRIRVNAVCPGWIDTAFNDAAIDMMGGTAERDAMIRRSVPLQRQGTADEVARVLAFLVSNDSSYITGQAIVVDGGLV